MKQIESEFKYIIKKPDIAHLSMSDEYNASEICQIYLINEGTVTHRIRKRVDKQGVKYTENRKKRISFMSVIEQENEISEEEFTALLSLADPICKPLYKTRHTFKYMGWLIEIDMYPEWQNCAVLEVEVPAEDTAVSLPQFIEVIMNATGDKKYSNHSMAHSFPEEPI